MRSTEWNPPQYSAFQSTVTATCTTAHMGNHSYSLEEISVVARSRTPHPLQSHMDLDLLIDEQRLVSRIDRRVLPILFFINLTTLLDRANVSSLLLQTPGEIGVNVSQAYMALSIFYVPYILLEIPSNICMKTFQPHNWLSGCILAAGVLTICSGFVTDFGGMMTIRFLLGIFQAGILSGGHYLISFWYDRLEAQKRFTIFWSSVLLVDAFGGLLADAIRLMGGIRGLSGWRWVFILEGIYAVVLSIIAYFTLPTFPREARWLTSDEKAFMLDKTTSFESHAVPITFRDVVRFFKDIKVYLVAIMYFAGVLSVYGMIYSALTIVESQGIDSISSKLHSVVPFVAAFASCVIIAYRSDQLGMRLPYILLSDVMLIGGIGVLLGVQGSFFAIEYAAICFMAMGAFGAVTGVVSWYLMNVRGHAERCLGCGWVCGFGSIGSLVATYSFMGPGGVNYQKGYWVCLSMAVLGTFTSLVYGALVHREKGRARDAGNVERLRILSL